LPEVKRVVNELQQMKARVQEERAKLGSLGGGPGGGSPLEVLREVSLMLDPGSKVRVTELLVDPESIEVNGEADAFETVNQLKARLDRSGKFKDVQLKTARASSLENVIEFKIQMKQGDGDENLGKGEGLPLGRGCFDGCPAGLPAGCGPGVEEGRGVEASHSPEGAELNQLRLLQKELESLKEARAALLQKVPAGRRPCPPFPLDGWIERSGLRPSVKSIKPSPSPGGGGMVVDVLMEKAELPP